MTYIDHFWQLLYLLFCAGLSLWIISVEGGLALGVLIKIENLGLHREVSGREREQVWVLLLLAPKVGAWGFWVPSLVVKT